LGSSLIAHQPTGQPNQSMRNIKPAQALADIVDQLDTEADLKDPEQ